MTIEQAHTTANELANKHHGTKFYIVWDSCEATHRLDPFAYKVAWPEELDEVFSGCKVVATHYKRRSTS